MLLLHRSKRIIVNRAWGLRILSNRQGFGGQDVLVLEYCDGSTRGA